MENQPKINDIKKPRNSNYLQNINLKDIFNDEEIDTIFQEFTDLDGHVFYDSPNIQSKGNNNNNNNGLKDRKKNSLLNSMKINEILCDRSKFILNILKLSSEKLKANNLTYLSKGVNWVKKEINESLLFKYNDLMLKSFDKLKTENKDFATVLGWVEEFSQIKNNGLNTKDNKRKSSPGYDIIVNYSKNKNLNNSDIIEEFKLNNCQENYINISDNIISEIEEITFNIFDLEKEVGEENILSTVSCYIFSTMGYYSFINYNKFENFIFEITKGYDRRNPYHNDLHAADVVHTCMIFIKKGKIDEMFKLDDLEICSLFIACIIHDFKHPGVTNGFLINTSDSIAIKYNDISVLENYHVSQAFKIINNNQNCNIFSDVGKDEMKIMRKKIIDCVISTDMTFHAKQFTYLKIKIENFSINKGVGTEKILEGLDRVNLTQTKQEFLNIIIHACDISNPTKPFNVYKNWAERVINEFWLQGDKEKELNLPISFLCDRATVTIPKSQIGFIDGIVYPFMNSLVNLFPNLEFLIENINRNKEEYKNLKE